MKTTASTSLEQPFKPPEEFEEYRIVRPIGEGAMGHVFLAEDMLLMRKVAVKFLAQEPDEAMREQFFVEARAIARLSHPNVVAIHRVGEIRGRPYLVSEYVRGETLAALDRPLGWERLLQIALGLARGLAAAHRRGVLHRDLKPANVMLDENDQVKLLDFGLARLVDEATSSTRGGIVGTPVYIAPEIFAGGVGTKASDLYSLGIMLYELASGQTPHAADNVIGIWRARQLEDVTPLAQAAVGIDRRFAAIVDRCLKRDPKERFASADAMRDALEELVGRPRDAGLPSGNPYRGLLPFDAEHRGLFFGRESEASAVLDRLRVERFVLVTGESGAGKSSLCRAGVLPLAEERCGFTVTSLVPGRHPLSALGDALAHLLGGDQLELTRELETDATAFFAKLRARAPHGILLFVDQMEELSTVADADEARLFCETLRILYERSRSVRVLASVRSDFLARMAGLPAIGEEVGRALYLLTPLSLDAMREAIVGPARAKGVRFESEELIDSLVQSSGRGLSSLQFALAALWDRRDHATGVIPASALAAIGGVDGALARHADAVMDRLPPRERAAARRILCRLVTPEGTRIARDERELIKGDDPSGRAALEALVRARLLIAHEGDDDDRGVYEIAHEALITGWDALRKWLAGDVEGQAARHRVERAASEWERLLRSPDALFGEPQLAELANVDLGDLAPREAAFVEASRARARRRRVARRALVLGAALVFAAAVGGGRWKARRDLSAAVAAHVARAAELTRRAHEAQAKLDESRRRAFSLFDSQRWPEGEEAWQTALSIDRDLETTESEAASILEGAIALEPADRSLRSGLADVLFERVLLAETFWRREQVAELSRRLEHYDDGSIRWHRLSASATLSIESAPVGADVTIETYADESGRLVPTGRHALGRTPIVPSALAPGSYLLTLTLEGHVEVKFPILAERGETLALNLPLPRRTDVPEGFVYVAPGRFLFGSRDAEDARRGFLHTVPLHQVATGAYLIARTETTFGEWIEYLNDLSAEERRARTPSGQNRRSSLELRELSGGKWRLVMKPTQQTFEADVAEPVRYARDRRAAQDWSRMPVTGVSYDDALAYTAWLDRTGRVPGARLCDEHEWERAARGADGRTFPSGEILAPDDANFDLTYGRQPLAFGPDEVGSHPGSRSPFGVDDLAGNVWEWPRSVANPTEVVNRGGSWYQGAMTARSANREVAERAMRSPLVGVRVCATPQAPRQAGPEGR